MQMPLHVIDVTCSDGLLDIIALGNIVEFTLALDSRFYNDTEIDEEEQLEIEATMARYRSFMRWFSKTFGLLMDGHWINPSYIFKRRLVAFAASVCAYYGMENPTTKRLDGINSIRVKKMFCQHLQKCWGDLIPTYDMYLAAPSAFLYHTGPPIRIVRKTHLHLLAANVLGKTEDIDYARVPIYPTVAVAATPTQPPAAPGAPKRAHIPSGSQTSPSSMKVTKRKK
jgi:hypothetical protein